MTDTSIAPAGAPWCRPDELRIAIVAPGEIFGGAERQILTLLSALGPRGCRVTLVLFCDSELAQRARAVGCPVIIVGGGRALSLESMLRLRAALQRLRPQVVHVHGYRAAVYCALSGNRGRSGTVKTEHGYPEPYAATFSRAKASVYHTLEGWATRWLRAHVVYVTEDLRHHLIGRYFRLESSVIHNGIEPLDRDSTRRPPEYQPDELNFAIVGRLDAVKGIHLALRALALGVLPTRTRLHLIGTGPLRAELAQLAGSLGVTNKVCFTGFRSNVYDYIAHADGLLLPSLHEGLPYTVLEAMALNTPIAAAAVGGLAEILRHDETALLFNAADVGSLAFAWRRLCQEPELGRRLAANACAECRIRFSAELMAESYLQLFRELAQAAASLHVA